MIDPDLKNQLDQINQNLSEIKKKTRLGIWRSFFTGMFSALGYVAGLAIVIVALGWVLQKTGLLPAFKDQVKNFTDVIDQAKKLTMPGSDNQSLDQKNNRGESTVILPDGRSGLPTGRQVKVQLPQ